MQFVILFAFYILSFNLMTKLLHVDSKPISSSFWLDCFFLPSFGFFACDKLQRSWLARSGSLLVEEDRSLFFSRIICHWNGKSPCSRRAPKNKATFRLLFACSGLWSLHSNRFLTSSTVTSTLNKLVAVANSVIRAICSFEKCARNSGFGWIHLPELNRLNICRKSFFLNLCFEKKASTRSRRSSSSSMSSQTCIKWVFMSASLRPEAGRL